MADDALLATARAWLDEDPDPETRAELEALIAAGDEAELRDRFSGTLQFGTAGLRGELGAGPNRMNRVVVIRAAAGLAAYLAGHGLGGPVVIGYDARFNSDVFARDTAEVLAGAGVEALLLPKALPTPTLAFAILHLGASAGVMVTASHNPPRDNGYKVYGGDGSQIVSPVDAEVSAHIAALGRLDAIPRSADYRVLDDEVEQAYTASVLALLPRKGSDLSIVGGSAASLSIVYTPMHGVGGAVATRVLEQAGFSDLHIVQEQFDPDPRFPTVAFPNPEEPGAMNLGLALAAKVDADLIIANDPDADRLAIGVRCPTGADGDVLGHRMLRGDEVGAIIGYRLLESGVKGVYATSIVSSSLLGAMAADHGQPFAETLTGFKWIGRLPGLVFGYEEALGYCVDPAHVKDKDGVSAALLVAHIAADLTSQGRTLLDLLDEIAVRYGVFATDQLSVRVEDLTIIANAMARLRLAPPTALAGVAVTEVTDFTASIGGLSPTDALRYRLADGSRVIVRPSGTEPKLKAYIEARVVVTGADVEAARTQATAHLAAIKADFAAVAGL